MPVGQKYVFEARSTIGNYLRFYPDEVIHTHQEGRKPYQREKWVSKAHSVCFHGKTLREIFKPDFKGEDRPTTAVEFEHNAASDHVVDVLAKYLEFREQQSCVALYKGFDFTKTHIIRSLSNYEKMLAKEEQYIATDSASSSSKSAKRLRIKESSPEGSEDADNTPPPIPKKVRTQLRAAHV
jgi:hypothetical protein